MRLACCNAYSSLSLLLCVRIAQCFGPGEFTVGLHKVKRRKRRDVTSLQYSTYDHDNHIIMCDKTDFCRSRKSFLGFCAASCSLIVATPKIVTAGLLDEYGSDPKEIKQRTGSPTFTASNRKGEAGIDPTLRAYYYYPTAKKRYLPRIKKVSDAISFVPINIQKKDWGAVAEFADKVAGNAVLPLKLYTSSLNGQGLSMSNRYAQAMMKDATLFERDTRDLQNAVKKQDPQEALMAVISMGTALTEFRKIGKLTGPDGSGDIPSIDDLRRMTMRSIH